MATSRRILDYVPGGIEYFVWDDETGEGRIEAQYDISTAITLNQQAQNDGTNGWTKSRDMKRVASIPMAMLEKWKVEEGIDWQNKDHWIAIKRKLNSSDYNKLRTDDLKKF